MDALQIRICAIQRIARPVLRNGASGPKPVIFFSHGYGPGRWQIYDAFLRHIVSRGYVVVFSSYPMFFATMEERYGALWAGFEAAAARFPDAIDLRRVGFVGHSFGGGATPAMAYRGIVQQGWGTKGAFLMELAPWYAYQTTPKTLRKFPANTVQLLEVYADDDVNDHRMAIDLYENSGVASQYYFDVRSVSVDGCNIVADHATPGRNPSLRLKQYAVFRPFDALADDVFNNAQGGRDVLNAMGHDGT